MKKGKHEAANGGGGWQRGGDPFAEESQPKAKKKGSPSTVKKAKFSDSWKGWGKGRKAGVVALCCLASLVLLAAGWWVMFVRAPDVSHNDRPGVTNNNPNNKQDQTPAEDVDLDGDGEPDVASGRKEDVFTFLLLGKDTGGGGNTDTMILVTYDVPNGTVNCVNIPRDTMINVSWSIKKINAVYASSRGIDGLKEEMGYLTGIVPDFYVAVEWEAIGEIVKALGGVEFDVPYNMDYDDPYQNLHIHQKKGLRTLNGDDAMQVIRWRKNNGDKYGIGDTGRQQIQQDFLKAVAKQCLQIGNWTKISEFAKIFFNNVETDIPLNNLLWFAQKAMGVDMENVNFHSLPGNDQGWYYTPSIKDNLAYFFADPAGIVELMNEHFNPYTRDITEGDLQIIYKTSNAALAMTNGTLADPKMAQPSVKPKSTPKASEEESEKDTVADEPVLPDAEEPADPGAADPGTTGPGAADPDSGTDTDPGTAAPEQPAGPSGSDPGAVDTDPGTQPPEGGGTMPEPVPEPEPQPEPAPEPEPELPPEPMLPEE
ncbi:MAG: LCP family protein [Oscillospiraceae bacterium]|nr:LCP family protein [Oscillospiraceae bacterium]